MNFDIIGDIVGVFGFLGGTVIIIGQVISGFIRQYRVRRLGHETWQVVNARPELDRIIMVSLGLIFFTFIMLAVWRKTGTGVYFKMLYPALLVLWCISNIERKIGVAILTDRVVLFDNRERTLKAIKQIRDSNKIKVEFTDTSDKLLILEFDINETTARLLSTIGDSLRP